MRGGEEEQLDVGRGERLLRDGKLLIPCLNRSSSLLASLFVYSHIELVTAPASPAHHLITSST